MTMDYSRRGLLRAATLAGIGALILPGTTLLPVARAAAPKLDPPPAAVTVNGWLLRSSDC
ncbi:twin-arginine translocation signal domain-containing protein [Vreelandella titanicae]|uniref:twin-arginine translocation signal domain-containing protein n=1 Tax=Vreelandella titanicae TaxID=664683 RepID=UPI000345CFC4|nr:twin-arginine translocation signal domain-containing protein [Halomonas titanicae]NVE91992.1 twin-arginine translocation signal domain-containing protein [Halomonas titanicae]